VDLVRRTLIVTTHKASRREFFPPIVIPSDGSVVSQVLGTDGQGS